MNHLLEPNSKVSATDVAIELEELSAEHVLDGNPQTGSLALGNHGDAELGLWEHTVGGSCDVEVDEFFVVLAGSATIEFLEPLSPEITVGPGDVVRLAAGTKTNWTVHETLRKIYFI